jgi:sugar lactone lactonase YvrE
MQPCKANLLVADYASGDIYELSSTGATTLFTSGFGGAEGLAPDGQGNLFIATIAGDLYKLPPKGDPILFGRGGSFRGLGFGREGNLYASDFATGEIYKFTQDGTQTVFASGLQNPMWIAFDRRGNLFATTRFVGDVYKISPTGEVSTFTSGLGALGGMAFDAAGNLFVGAAGCSGCGKGAIYEFTPDGTRSTFVAAGLSSPTGMVFDERGDLFVADNDYGKVFKITADGDFSAFSTAASDPTALALTVCRAH